MEQAGGERTSTKFYWRVTDRQTNGHLATVYSALPCKIQSVGLFVFVQSPTKFTQKATSFDGR